MATLQSPSEGLQPAFTATVRGKWVGGGGGGIRLQDTSVLLREQADRCMFFTVEWRESLLKHERRARGVTAPLRSHVKDPCGAHAVVCNVQDLLPSCLPRFSGETV